ncbi:hypothetical protein PAHAL_7G104100 [Panicum hallii]|jgi:hypothetical protein|uniref:Late embryogenesis abundant protein LEA-2 subgroup domain-containing protein n=1 Tax=Panicum hallii TaxID=206008 RepID=A0A2S3I5N6_9POAL|nr:hypothetical protein PAHAL_7G104100 [Panicum hallii]
MARRPVRKCKCYTLSVLAASLAAAAIISVVSVEMRPAHIFFSITQATTTPRNDTSGAGGATGMELSITLAANNTSRRASVLYRSIYIAICSKTGRPLHVSEAGACIGTVVATTLPLRQKPRITERIHAAVALEGASSPWASLGVVPRLQDILGDRSSSHYDLSVKVTALVMFKTIGGVPGTRLHDINVTCTGVTFVSQANQSSFLPSSCFYS